MENKWYYIMIIGVVLCFSLSPIVMSLTESEAERKAEAYEKCLRAADKFKRPGDECKELLK